MIDLEKLIQELRHKKELVERAIAQLEELAAESSAGSYRDRRGRKSMGEAERRQVSVRMKSYWERRRKDAASSRQQASG